MNGIDNVLMYKTMQEAHCPDPRCVARYRPAAMNDAGNRLAEWAKREGMPLTHLRDFVVMVGTKPNPTAL